MDRVNQLKNVAFGGAWSEQIAGDEALRQALGHLKEAIERTVEEDLRRDTGLQMSLQVVARVHPKGSDLFKAWHRALDISFVGPRASELCRIHRLLEIALIERLK